MARENSRIGITISRSPTLDVRYVSGLMAYCEQFSGSKLVGKRWSADGCIGEDKASADFKIDVPSQAFSLNVDGQSLDWGWEIVSAAEREHVGRRVATVELRHTARPVGVKVHTEVDGTSFLSRWLEITNSGSAPAALSSMDVFSGVLASGADLGEADFQKTPFILGRFIGNNDTQEGRFVWEPLVNGVVTGLQASGPWGTCGNQCPYFLLSNRRHSEFFAFYLGWSGLWRAEILCDTTLHHILHVRMGPTAPAPMRVLRAGETIFTPRVHVGHLASDLDGCVQAAHEHLRSSVFRRSPRMAKPLLTHNSAWSQGLKDLNEEAMLRDIDHAHELGTEVYMVDAGWYGKAPDDRRKSGPYPRLMGDWVPGEWFPHGFDPIVRRIRDKGMLFGLWFEPEGVGVESRILKAHPDWIVKREGRPLPPVNERLTLDYTHPEVRKWVESELSRIIRDYHVDVIRFDGAPMSAYVGERRESGYVENIIWRHYEFLYAMMDGLAERFPDLLIENCSGGGGRLDLGILSRSHRTQITDEVEPPRIVQVLNGISLMLPPEHCVMYTLLPTRNFEGYDLDFLFRTILMTGFYHGGVPNRSPGHRTAEKRYTSLFKSFVAPLLPGCRVYHHTPVVRLKGELGEEPTPYCVLEYTSADSGSSIVGIFKLSDATEPYPLRLRGLDARRKYRLTFDNDASTRAMDGHVLQQQGITVDLPRALTSELILLEAVRE